MKKNPKLQARSKASGRNVRKQSKTAPAAAPQANGINRNINSDEPDPDLDNAAALRVNWNGPGGMPLSAEVFLPCELVDPLVTAARAAGRPLPEIVSLSLVDLRKGAAPGEDLAGSIVLESVSSRTEALMWLLVGRVQELLTKDSGEVTEPSKTARRELADGVGLLHTYLMNELHEASYSTVREVLELRRRLAAVVGRVAT